MASRDQTRPTATSGTAAGASASDEATASSKAGDPSSVVNELADAAMNEARAAADRVTGVARERARSLFSRQQRVISDQIRGVADAKRETAQKLDQGESGIPGRYIGEAADRAEDFAEALEARGMEDLADELEMFARRQPELFLGASVGVGLLLGRFLKASSERRRVSRSPTVGSEQRRRQFMGGREDAAGSRSFAGSDDERQSTQRSRTGSVGGRHAERSSSEGPRSMGAGAGGYGAPIGGTGVGGLGDTGSGRAGTSDTTGPGKAGVSPLGAGTAPAGSERR